MFRLKYYSTIRRFQRQHLDVPSAPVASLDPEAGGKPSLLGRLAAAIPISRLLLLRAVGFVSRPRLVVVKGGERVRRALNDERLRVPFGVEIDDLTHATNGVLGLDGAEHGKQRQIVDQVMPAEDVERLRAHTGQVARVLLDASMGRIDAVRDLIGRTATETCAAYFGLEVEDPDAFADATRTISALVFADPLGSLAARDRALVGAARVQEVVDRAIDRALAHRDQPAADLAGETVIERLARQRVDGRLLTKAEIRAHAMVMITGFIPTNTLAAGKILQKVLSRRAIFEKVVEQATAAEAAATAAEAKPHRDELESLLFEAGRHSPALDPGQFRFAEAGPSEVRRWLREGPAPVTGEARLGKPGYRAGTVVVIATAHALRTAGRFSWPRKDGTLKRPSPDLMFGDGPHVCAGRAFARAQITEIFQALFSRPGLQRVGRMKSAGAYPYRQDMRFTPPVATRDQSLIAICAHVPQNRLEKIEAQLRALSSTDEMRQALDATGFVHFASISLIDTTPRGADPEKRLLLEFNVDGEQDRAIARLAEALQPLVGPILGCTPGTGPRLVDVFKANLLRRTTWPWGATGVDFRGTPQLSVTDIARQARLATLARDALAYFQKRNLAAGSRAILALDFMRRLIRQDPDYRTLAAAEPSGELAALLRRGREFRDDLIRPGRQRLAMAQFVERSQGEAVRRTLASKPLRRVYVGVLAAVVATAGVFTWALGPPQWLKALASYGLSFSGAVVTMLLALGLGALLVRWRLRALEERDLPDDRNPPLENLARVTDAENRPGFVQNHFVAVTLIKRGPLRRLALAGALWVVGEFVRHWFRPGFVLNMGTIHFARWIRIPGTGRLLFLANYDGSWESYLEDFIMRAHNGQTAVWSNSEGFPRTRDLQFEGASDGDRFKRYVRRQQQPTLFWYSRFPHLTTDQMRNNALIQEGLIYATTDTAARAWLDCFGSAQRPPSSVEASEVQSLMFQGLSWLPHATCALVRLPQDAGERSAWLRAIAPADALRVLERQAGEPWPVSFGDRPFVTEARRTITCVAFSSDGLRRCGLARPDSEHGLGAFPGVFNLGMGRRSQVLGDAGPSDPAAWAWSDKTVDAAILIYGADDGACEAELARHLALLGGEAACAHRIRMGPVAVKGLAEKRIDYEHFGFRDGISQPVIKGTPRAARGARKQDLVEPGEFILGYKANQGYFPPNLTVASTSDERNRLPAIEAQAPGRFPSFAPKAASDLRDFGRNGSFLVLRQLSQDAKGFDRATAAWAEQLKRDYPQLADVVGQDVNAHWVAAKMVGRWRTGEPLLERKPRRRRNSSVSPDNDFSFAVDDPQGLHCPLGAHIRRANPRGSQHPADETELAITNRHRLLRRGRPYDAGGSGLAEDRPGLLFACLCADLERQFEFVQQTWISAPGFQGLVNEPDPLLRPHAQAPAGPPPADPNAPDLTPVFTIPTASGPVQLRGVQSFVTARGGGYFFLPSLSALQYLAELGAPSTPEDLEAARRRERRKRTAPVMEPAPTDVPA